MQEEAIQQLDHAALALVQALELHGTAVAAYLDPAHLSQLHAELVNLRRVLLGLEMGVLYEKWDVPETVLTQADLTALPVEVAAERIAKESAS